MNTGKPKESRLNHGNVFGGTYAFRSVPASRKDIPTCTMKNIRRMIFTKF